MMLDLGQYAVVVLSSWAITLGLIGVLVWHSIARARRVRAELQRIEGDRE